MKIVAKVSYNGIFSLIEEFLLEKGQICENKTIRSYKGHFHRLSELVDFNQELTKSVCQELYRKVAELDISQESKNSYLRTWRAFINYADSTLPSPKLKKVESIKRTYSDKDIIKLTKPPQKPYSFLEYRAFMITLILFDTGMRASSLRNIMVEDIQDGSIILRHNKTKKSQIIPFGSVTAKHLKTYLEIIKPYNLTYLFTNQYGEQLTESALTKLIKTYNLSRGVTLYSIHSWRHTFSKKYLLDCGGNAFILQQLLNHSTLDTTKIYCRLYNKEVIENYKSPLETVIKTKIITK